MRKRFNTVVVDTRDEESGARLVWVEPETIFVIASYEHPFSIMHDGRLVDVEVVVEDDVREFALRERLN